MKYIPYGHQNITIEDIKEVVKVLKSDFITQGPKTEEFEKKLAKKVGAKYAVVFNSGTAGLHAAYFAYGLTSDDEFITSPMTFAATANAGVYLGAKPVFCDIEEDTGNIDPNLIEKHITKKTKLITPIHYGGNPVKLDKIHKIAKKYKIGVIEDACHALGAEYKNSKIGDCKYSDMTVFSFHPVKHITTGEGGAVTTNNSDYYKKLLTFRTHGITKENLLSVSPGGWYYEMQYLGFNYLMSDIQAALGISQLTKLSLFLKKRRDIAKIYDKVFYNNPYFDTQKTTKDSKAAYHLYPILLKDQFIERKAEIFSELRARGIGVQVHYIPVYLHPYYQKLGYSSGLYPNAELFYKKEIS
ncbi:MAG: UDP-4-amino-4,6-dideoxy-N-acetyl-beta-L-altrosamine transaminase, partial [Bacteroidales bacterium]|nr:UDP-4-amino-4,6-dideoxy-N-acetyl-beta-L-altrosamine transaminase [Bacteroidales bacterium]